MNLKTLFKLFSFLLLLNANEALALCVGPEISVFWESSTQAEVRLMDVSYTTFRAKYDQMWNAGYRLRDIDVNYIYGQVSYSGIWRPGTTGEYVIFDGNSSYFSEKKSLFESWGYRIEMLDTYVDHYNVVRYTAVFRPSAARQVINYGVAHSQIASFVNTYHSWGYKVKQLNLYYKNSTPLYTLVVEQNTSAQVMVAHWGENDFINKCIEMKNAGFRIYSFDTEYTGNQTVYTATWRPGTQFELRTIGQEISSFKSNNFYYNSGYSYGYRIGRLSVCGPRTCNDHVLIGVTERQAQSPDVEPIEFKSDAGSNEDLMGSAIKVYPTASPEGIFTVEINNHFEQSNLSVHLYDLKGVKYTIPNENISLGSGSNEVSINLSDKPSGSYLLRFEYSGIVISKYIFITKE